MKPFNLKEYLANPSRKIVTRDGRNTRIICIDAYINIEGKDFPIIALIEDRYKKEYSSPCTKYGKSLVSRADDLFFALEKHKGWINLYKNKDGVSWISSNYFKSKKEAEEEGKNYTCNVITIEIEWEEQL